MKKLLLSLCLIIGLCANVGTTTETIENSSGPVIAYNHGVGT